MSEELLWARLATELEGRVDSFPGVAGLQVLDLTGPFQVSVRADVTFPTASMIKMHVLAHLLERAEAGEVDLCRRVTVDDDDRVDGSGVLAYLDHRAELTVRDLAVLMIIASDNSATNLCIDWATFEGTNAMNRRLGLPGTVLRRKMSDRAAMERGDENVSTPGEMVRFLERLYRGEGLSPWVCAETLRVLRKPKRGYLAPGLPEDVLMANKPGGLEGVRSDAAIVFLDRRPYAICVMTNYGPADRIAQERFVAETGALVHEHMTTLDRSTPYGLGIVRPIAPG
jgi:beta-lactamase class A